MHIISTHVIFSIFNLNLCNMVDTQLWVSLDIITTHAMFSILMSNCVIHKHINLISPGVIFRRFNVIFYIFLDFIVWFYFLSFSCWFTTWTCFLFTLRCWLDLEKTSFLFLILRRTVWHKPLLESLRLVIYPLVG